MDAGKTDLCGGGVRTPAHLPQGWWAGTIVALCATGMALVAAFISLSLSREYYSQAPYHYDSAAYRVDALEIYDALQSQGLKMAALLALGTKDSFDLLLRLLVVPDALQHRYGHMVILVPVMALFMVMTSLYVFRSTGRIAIALLCPATLFTYQLFYNAYWGIADYWKDNLATWLLGSALMAWLFSEDMRKRGWSIVAGLLLGMTAMQRTSGAVYAAVLLSPLFAWAVVVRCRAEGIRKGLLRTAAFLLPAVLLGALLLCMQAQQLYDYYFKGGYAYGTSADVLRFLLSGISPRLAQPVQNFFPGTEYGIGLAPLLLVPGYLLAFVAARGWSLRKEDINKTLWCALGLPLILIAASLYYYGAFALWPVLLVVFLATLLAHTSTSPLAHALTLVLALSIATGSVYAYHDHTSRNRAIVGRSAGYRTLLIELATLITDDPADPRPYATFFNETGAPFTNHARFDLGRKIGPPAVFITFHDQYFRRTFPGMTSDEIVASEMSRLESQPNAIAIAHADTAHLYQPTSDPIASAAILGFHHHLYNNPRWQIVNDLPSPFGPLLIYRLVPVTTGTPELAAPELAH
ncbi:MAG: hypothetical protein HQ523_01970 [Lentisphaerae bacterium]|nr:hypothetical protein [Lentisphaerota bacterium]